MPAAQGRRLVRWPLRGFFDRDGRYEQQRTHEPRLRLPALGAPTNRSRSLLAFERSTVLAVSRADLDTAARGAGRTWPTALAVRADTDQEKSPCTTSITSLKSSQREPSGSSIPPSAPIA